MNKIQQGKNTKLCGFGWERVNKLINPATPGQYAYLYRSGRVECALYPDGTVDVVEGNQRHLMLRKGWRNAEAESQALLRSANKRAEAMGFVQRNAQVDTRGLVRTFAQLQAAKPIRSCAR